MSGNKCIVCRASVDAPTPVSNADRYEVNCPRCHRYQVEEEVWEDLTNSTKELFLDYPRHLLAAAIRNASDNERLIVLKQDNTSDIIAAYAPPDGPIEGMDRILLYLYRRQQDASAQVLLDIQNDYPIACCKSADEFEYYLRQLNELKYLEPTSTLNEAQLSVEGWKRIAELRQRSVESHQAFVAMWFHESMDQAWNLGFSKALADTGYSPKRMDKVEHNDKVDDRIIADIRKSGLLVADFTGGRGGVYFEAGFAFGLGLPVIWTCREDHKDQLHFDTRQYNHIFWKDEAELYERLVARIEATLPHRKQRVLTKTCG